MRELFRKFVGGARPISPSSDVPAGFANLEWLYPPGTVTDPVAWDEYWKNQLDHGVAGFVHLFCSDGALVDAMTANGFRTVLCVGSGLSLEPHALAAAGFDVTALDLSPLAMQTAERAQPAPEILARLLEDRSFNPGGRVRFAAGDLLDPSICTGPFDVVIERRTLQLFADDERPAALDAVANRLAGRGIFFSHSHDGRWRPPADPIHATASWFAKHRWTRWAGQRAIEGRVAWLLTTTG